MKTQFLQVGKGAAVAALGVMAAIALINNVKAVEKFTGRV